MKTHERTTEEGVPHTQYLKRFVNVKYSYRTQKEMIVGLQFKFSSQNVLNIVDKL